MSTTQSNTSTTTTTTVQPQQHSIIPFTLRIPESTKTNKQQQINKHSSNKKSVSFTDDTIDNEYMNKKKSKKCCIFHKQRNFDQSSSDSDNSDSNSDTDNSSHRHNHQCKHQHNNTDNSNTNSTNIT